MFSRRNFLIRSIASVSGDIAIGVAVAATCVWIIEAAALGLFLSFLLWLLAVILALAFSQHVLHPAVRLVLSDQKLDWSLAATAEAMRSSVGAAHQLWAWTRQGVGLRS